MPAAPVEPVAPVLPVTRPNAKASAPELAVKVALAVGVPPADTADTLVDTELTLPSSATRLPLPSNPSCLFALVVTSGRISDAVVSKSDNINARFAASSISAAIAIILSNSVFKVLTLNGPDNGKSVTRSISISRVITTLEPPVAPVT